MQDLMPGQQWNHWPGLEAVMTVENHWAALAAHQAAVADRRIGDLFADARRAARFSAVFDHGDGRMLLDYSKTNLDATGRQLLLDLATATGVADRRDAMFSGAPINNTEGRAALHVMLRGSADPAVSVDLVAAAQATQQRMADFARAVRDGTITGSGGGFTDVVSIGIGGSDLGPALATAALAPWHDGPRCHFVANIDGADLTDRLRGVDPRRTLVVVVSKTFTTQETMTNAATVRDWLLAGGGVVERQMVAVSSAVERAAQWGIPAERVFGFGDFIGGRYSVWGPVGLALMLAVGPEEFAAFGAGAAQMDAHFRTAPLADNLPVLLALIGIWHHQICGYPTRAVLPYDQRLAQLPAYLQQLEMESNGKGVDRDGRPLPWAASPVVWGAAGTNGQHAFFQLLHQGRQVVPCEFLIAARGNEPALAHHHRLLVANCLAQSAALLRGRSLDEARELLTAQGLSGAALEAAAAHRVFPGNRPSVTLAYDRLTPAMLGRILALYEHRVLVEGTILGINSFDQWGVELGKELAQSLVAQLQPDAPDHAAAAGIDGSTRLLLKHLRHDAGGVG